MLEKLKIGFRVGVRNISNATFGGRDLSHEFNADLSGMILVLNTSNRIKIRGVNYRLFKDGLLYHAARGLGIDQFTDSIGQLFNSVEFRGRHFVYSGDGLEKHYFDLSSGSGRVLRVDYTLKVD